MFYKIFILKFIIDNFFHSYGVTHTSKFKIVLRNFWIFIFERILNNLIFVNQATILFLPKIDSEIHLQFFLNEFKDVSPKNTLTSFTTLFIKIDVETS